MSVAFSEGRGVALCLHLYKKAQWALIILQAIRSSFDFTMEGGKRHELPNPKQHKHRLFNDQMQRDETRQNPSFFFWDG